MAFGYFRDKKSFVHQDRTRRWGRKCNQLISALQLLIRFYTPLLCA